MGQAALIASVLEIAAQQKNVVLNPLPSRSVVETRLQQDVNRT